MQSSHATIVLILTALSVGQINYENALALTIGANIGTTITAIIGSLSSNIDGKRLAGGHFVFNVVTAVVAILFIHQIMDLVNAISNALGIAADNHTLKLAVFDSFFKVMGVLMFIPFVDKLVVFLRKTIRSKHLSEEQKSDHAKYLNDATLELPSTAMAAIIRETKHLYENAFEVITHGLNLKRSNIISSMPLDEVVKDTYTEGAFDIDDFYNRNIKGIYGEIIDFSTKAQSLMSPSDIDSLYKLKLANRDIVEAVKDTKHLQKNMIKYTRSPNEHIREQYNGIKRDLAELLRDIHLISTTEEEDEIIILLSKAKLHTEKYDILANGTLDNLIRNGLITNEMATSLMNDSTYAYNISTNLLAMAEIIFVDENSALKELGADTMVLDDEDVKTILREDK
jgi:phosphate:Na+ symporter